MARSGGGVALTLSGATVLLNSGTIEQTGAARAINSTAAGSNLTVTNTGLISSGSEDAFRVNNSSSVSLSNSGTIQSTAGAQAIDWANITGSNSLMNQAGGSITAVGQDAVRPGPNGTVNNSGVIRATPMQEAGSASSSDGVDGRVNTGIQVVNVGIIEGRTAVTGGDQPVAPGIPPAFAISVTNQSGGVISGVNGSGVNIDGVATNVTASIANQAGALMKGTWDGVSANGDGDGIDVDGVLTLTNRGFIRGLGANGNGSDGFANGPDGVAAGGGTIVNEAGAEITAGVTTGNATSSFGILIDNSSKGDAIAATSLTNRGLVKSDNGPSVVFIATFPNTITNEAGATIRGAGVGAAIQSGNGSDTINNSGAIIGDNGLAIDMQGGNNTLNILGGAASIVGDITAAAGGTDVINIDPGSGNSFSYAGALSSYSAVAIKSGTVTLSGASTLSPSTNVTVSGGTLLAQNRTGSAAGSATTLVNNGARLGGNGTVATVTVNNGGTVAPGTSAGRLTIDGNYNQAGGATLAIELGGTAAGTQHDQLAVTGQAAIAGTLNLTLIGGFQPAVGQTFQIITSSSATGNFAVINSSGFKVNSSVSHSGVVLTVTSVGDATPTPGPTATATPTPTPGGTPPVSNTRLANISTRLRVETGDAVLIGGIIVTGTEPKPLLVRAIGPSLAVDGALADPQLELYNSAGELVAFNNNWRDAPNAREIEESTIPPSNDLESAIRVNVSPGAYTAIVSGVNEGRGVALVEAYDLNREAASKLANIATRGLVQTDANILIAGTIVTGAAPQRVLVRAIGPSLNLPSRLADPTLELLDANGELIRANNNWRNDQEAEINASGIPPTDDLEAALIATLPADGASYTAIVRGVNDTTGIGVVEIYALPAGEVTITSPANGSTVGTTVMIQANAAAATGTITSVSFYDGATFLGSDTSSPYNVVASLAPGSHALTAVAVHDNGQVTTSPTVNVTAVAGSGSLTRGPYLQKAAPTEMTIRWRNTVNDVGRVRYGTSPEALDQTADEAAAPASGFNHEVTLTGLTANTTYYYNVGSGSDVLAPVPPADPADFTFTTSPNAGTPINTRIWVLGDAGTAGYRATNPADARGAGQTAVRDAFYTWTGTRTPNLVLQLGDSAYDSGTDAEFQLALFDMYPTMLRKTTFWSALGNHETAQSTNFVDTYPYFDIYTLPKSGEAGGVPSGTEHYYSFDYGNIHFISLDSMTASRAVDDPNTPGINEDGPMAAWLRTDLESTTATWIIAFFHHPPYTKGSHNSDTEGDLIQIRQNILPILEAGGVDLTLTGHSHSYERSYLLDGHYGFSGALTPAMKVNAGDGRPAGSGAYIKPLNDAGGHKGTVHAVAGSAGKATFLQADGPHPAHFITLLNLGSLVLDVDGNRLDGTFLRENGTTADTFTIIKQ